MDYTVNWLTDRTTDTESSSQFLFVIYFPVVVRSNSAVLRSAAVVLQCSVDFRRAPC